MDPFSSQNRQVGRSNMESTMQSMILQNIRSHFIRACLVVGERSGQQMDTSIREQIWAEMVGEVYVPPVVRQTTEVPLLAAAPAEEVDYEALGRAPGGFSTPKRPTKPVEPKAPARPAKPADEESVAESEEKEDTKLSPQQKLEKQKNTTTEKLDKLRARQGTAKQTAKQKEADPKEIAKLEEKLKDINAKLAKAQKPNFEKWTPTWTKHFKTAADAAKMEVNEDTKGGFVDYLNRLTLEEFKKPSYLEHATRYFQQRAAAGVGLLPDPAEKKEEAAAGDDDDEEVYEVTYDGELYTVGEHSRKVYKVTEEGDVPVTHLDDIKAVLSKLDKQLGK